MTNPYPTDPQPRRAFVEPANGVDQWQQPVRPADLQHRPPSHTAHHYPAPPWQAGGQIQGGPVPPPIVINNVAHAQAAAVAVGPRTNHLLHLILTICTGGLWGIAWLILWLSRGCR